MSELLGDKKAKVEALKSVIKELHAGAKPGGAEGEVR